MQSGTVQMIIGTSQFLNWESGTVPIESETSQFVSLKISETIETVPKATETVLKQDTESLQNWAKLGRYCPKVRRYPVSKKVRFSKKKREESILENKESILVKHAKKY
ncbi:hypothetical protein U1Q18_052402 [Sarracenia purpurea var. burkii]